MHYRGGNCSEVSCLRSKEILSFTSFVTSELMIPGVYCTHLFSPCHEMCGSRVVTRRNFVFVAILGIPLHLLCLLTLLVHSFMGCNWLFFLVTCQYLGQVSCQQCHLYLVPVILNVKLYHLKCVCVEISDTTNMNRYLLTEEHAR